MMVEWFNIIWQVSAVVFAAGVVWGELKAIRKDISRLEEKQDRYNNLQERTHDLEMWKEYHEKEHRGGK